MEMRAEYLNYCQLSSQGQVGWHRGKWVLLVGYPAAVTRSRQYGKESGI